jgi:hypothetical protein
MYSRTFNISVCLMWLLTMSWLITQKVLPSLWVGQPPDYQAIIDAQKNEPVGWTMWIKDGQNEKKFGWALSTFEDPGQGPKEIHNYIHFNELPLEEFTAGLGRTFFRLLEQPLDKHEMDVDNTLTIDSLGNLSRFDSRITIKLEPIKSVLRMQGVVDGPRIRVEVRSGDFSYNMEMPLPQHALLNDALSPQTQLPNLAVGQSWAVPTFSPFLPNRMEMLRATVEEKEPVVWNAKIYDAWLVVYSNDPGADFGTQTHTRGKTWVLENGTVIKQQVKIFDTSLSFVRMTDVETAQLVKLCEQKGENNE